MAQDLTKLFNKFAGKEVQSPVSSKIDPTISEMKKLAEDNGLKLRLWYPGMMGTMDFKGNRINAYVEKGADGKYRVSNEFKIG
jgi:hypothetical protein